MIPDLDLRQGPYLINVYAATQDTNDLNFDRVATSLGWRYYRFQLRPALAFWGWGVMKVILNDRNGNVSEHFSISAII
jgi:hypothetical protein